MRFLRDLTLRQIIIAVYCITLFLTLVIAGGMAISLFSDGMDARAEDAVSAGMRITGTDLQQIGERSATVLRHAAAARGLAESARTGSLTSAQLRGLAAPEDFAVLFVTDSKGKVLGSSGGGAPYTSEWAAPLAAAASESSSTVDIVPASDLEALGIGGKFEVKAKETPNGTVVAGEDSGALAMVAFTPLPGAPGLFLFGIRPANGDVAYVDGIAQKVGGVATIFQHGVRVMTTVRNDKGERAVGTVISDKVRAACLETGKPYRGEAFVVNKTYMAGYDPIIDRDGKVIGMLFIGLPPDVYTGATERYTLTYSIIMVLALAANAAIAYFMSGKLVAPLREVTKMAEVVATGDLTSEVPASGFREARVLGESFNTMIRGLRQLIGYVEQAAGQLGEVAGHITSSSRTTADRASHQAASIAETTAGLDELARTFGTVSDSAQRVTGIAEDSLEAAESGRETVDHAAGAMDALAGGSREVLNAAAALAESAETIGGITSLITGIAEQTKILALNAAIEAARAGDAGHGFSVVSTEIRALAESVSESAGRISALVTEIQASSANLAKTAERQAEVTGDTLTQSMGTRDALDGIVAKMAETAAAAREIATAAAEQKQAASQILNVMHDVSTTSSEAAQSAGELAAAAGQVEAVSGDLFKGMAGFKTKG